MNEYRNRFFESLRGFRQLLVELYLAPRIGSHARNVSAK